MSGDLENVLGFDQDRLAQRFSDIAEYGLNSSLSIDHISIIAMKCEQLFYKNVRDYRIGLA